MPSLANWPWPQPSSDNDTEKAMAREFIQRTLNDTSDAVFADADSCRAKLEALSPDPDHMLWFEYNFLYVLAPNGSPAKDGLGDHGPLGYEQRKRFYAISDEGRLQYSKRVAEYLIFLAETTGVRDSSACAQARTRLDDCSSFDDFIADIQPQ